MESLYTVEELREQFGLEIFPDTSCLGFVQSSGIG